MISQVFRYICDVPDCGSWAEDVKPVHPRLEPAQVNVPGGWRNPVGCVIICPNHQIELVITSDTTLPKREMDIIFNKGGKETKRTHDL